MDIVGLCVQLASGAAGGGAGALLQKKYSLGPVGDSIVGILGGGLGGQILGMLGAGGAGAGGGMDIGSIVSSIAGGGVTAAALSW